MFTTSRHPAPSSFLSFSSEKAENVFTTILLAGTYNIPELDMLTPFLGRKIGITDTAGSPVY